MTSKQIDKYKLAINLESSKIGKFVKSLPLLSFSEKLRKGIKEEIELRDGLKIVVNEYNLSKPIAIDFSIGNAPLEFAFCLAGEMEVEINSSTIAEGQHLSIDAGTCSIFYLPNSSGKMKLNGKKLKVLSLHISPDYLQAFASENETNFPVNISNSIWGLQPLPFVLSDRMNNDMILACNQVLERVFSGLPKSMFLESKSLELMTLMIDNFFNNPTQENGVYISKANRLKIIELKDFIDNNLNEIPSLSDLADKLSLTHTKLNYFFKTIVGFTVFAYIREKRLEKAKDLLLTDQSISEISYQLGFSSPSHLSKDFSNKYGLSPKEYKKSLAR